MQLDTSRRFLARKKKIQVGDTSTLQRRNAETCDRMRSLVPLAHLAACMTYLLQ